MTGSVAASGPGFLERWGLALVAPSAAMQLADDPRGARHAAGDLLRALVVVLIATHTRDLVAAAWIGWELSVADAWPGLLRAVSNSAMVGLVFVVIAAPVVTLGAGLRRNFGRDFDLACVAALVPVTIAIVMTLLTTFPIAGSGSSSIARGIMLVSSLGWGGAVTAVAIAKARSRR